MDVLTDGRARADGGAEPSIQQLRPGKNQIRHRPLCERNQPALRRAQQTPQGSRVHRRRLFDRGYGELSLGGGVQAPEPEHRRLSAPQAVARDHPRAAGHGARLRNGQRGQSEFWSAGNSHRGRAQAVVRPDRGGGEVDGANIPSHHAGLIRGAAPNYADYIVFGGFQWARVVSPFKLLAENDPVYAWRERLLDAFDGMARQSPGPNRNWSSPISSRRAISSPASSASPSRSPMASRRSMRRSGAMPR